jgi:hypothetical protein
MWRGEPIDLPMNFADPLLAQCPISSNEESHARPGAHASLRRIT